jgi:hypothetical protein
LPTCARFPDKNFNSQLSENGSNEAEGANTNTKFWAIVPSIEYFLSPHSAGI